MFENVRGKESTGGRSRLWLGGGLALAIVVIVLVVRALGKSPPPPPAASASPPPAAAPRARPAEGAMVRIEGGTFRMGTDDGDEDEKPVHDQRVGSFEIDALEVSVGAYATCVAAGKCVAALGEGDCNWNKPERRDHPVNCVDYAQAMAYCAFVGKRLPTEREWELAARGTENRLYPWGNATPAGQLCWSGEGSDLGKGNQHGTCPVGSHPAGATPQGVEDLAGNVWEWTSSRYCPYPGDDCGTTLYVFRGGGWNNFVPRFVRAADRTKDAPTTRNDNLGFRCAR